MNLYKYGTDLYDINTTITRLICLALLDNNDPLATHQLEEITQDLPPQSYAALFKFDEDEVIEDGAIPKHAYEYTLEMRRGWCVSANTMIPRNISFSEDGTLEGYSSNNAFYSVVSYGETLEEALTDVIREAKLLRYRIFDKEREKRRVPNPYIKVPHA